MIRLAHCSAIKSNSWYCYVVSFALLQLLLLLMLTAPRHLIQAPCFAAGARGGDHAG